MKRTLLIFILSLILKNGFSQGCVAIRSNGNTCSMASHKEEKKGWELNLNNRYFKSYKHFVGTAEQKQRVDSGTQVINHAYSLDITLTRNLNSRWSLAITVPVISNTRSSKYEHYGNGSKSPNARRNTHAFGLGDIKFAAYRWMFDSARSSKGNLQLGLGLKLATGNYNVQDYFYKNDTTITYGPVDQSIQLGDGGTGITVEAKGYYNFNHKIGVYGDVYYLINPAEQNGTLTTRGGTVSASALKYFTNTMSIPDQYMARVGANYTANKFTVSAGVRIEGIPSSDLIGGDKGFRRPGYVISAEPVASYTVKRTQFYVSIPVALERNRTQSNADKLQSAATGTKVQGDAAFADYLVNVGCTFRF